MRRLPYSCYLFLACLTLGFCYLFCLRYGMFGAKVDWISQHSVLPDYFRQQFYDTGRLFPEFAANIGGGQNIYNFSYYGLYNPLILPSYLLPFVKMSDYMMAIQLLGLTASVLLMYRWLEKRGFSWKICVGMAILFLLAGPVIFHSYNQIMFINYMPFLLTGLWGVDRYFEKQKSGLLTVSIFLMIMTSFYFSIGGMLVLVLYGIHRYLMVCDEAGEKVSVKSFLTAGLKFSLYFVLAVLMSGVLLAPTAFALTGREGEGAAVGLGELLFPKVSMTRFCYSPYGIGMTTLAVTAVIALVFGRKWYERALALSCAAVLTVPVFAYLLNGGLYVRDKVMIPFLPLLCYITAYYLEGLESRGKEKETEGIRRIARLGESLPYILTIVMVCLNRQQGDIRKYWKLLLLDSVLMLVCFLVLRLCQRRSVILLAPSILMLLVFDYTCHTQADRGLNRKFYEEITDSEIGEKIESVTAKEEGFYRTEQLGSDNENAANLNRIWTMGQYVSSVYSSSYHEGYREFRQETFQLEEPFRNFLMQSAVHNPVYQRFMGIKYVVSRDELLDYEPVEYDRGKKDYEDTKENGKQGDEWRVYENTQVSPVVYGTNRVISKEDFLKLEFPYRQLALLEYAVVEDAGDFSENAPIVEDVLAEWVSPIETDLPLDIASDTDQEVQVKLPDSLEGEEGQRVLFLCFQIENQRPLKDVAVWVEGIRNKLTARSHFYYNDNTEFTYGIPLKEGQETVEMVFGKGRYEIKEVEAYIGRLPSWEGEKELDDRLYQSVFEPDWEKTKGNRIEGSIDVKREGYVITTIPYDENFELLVDGEPVREEEVNTAFLGFRIGAGVHEVRLLYHAPGVKAGKLMSMAGLIIFCGMILRQKKCRKSRHLPPFPRLQMFV